MLKRQELELMETGQLAAIVDSHGADTRGLFTPPSNYDVLDDTDVEAFVEQTLADINGPEAVAYRIAAQQNYLEYIAPRIESNPLATAKLFLFDVDDTLAPLYPIANATANRAMIRYANALDLDLGTIYRATRTIPGELICHSPESFSYWIAQQSGFHALSPQHINHPRSILEDWHTERALLNHGCLFPNVVKTFRQIKESGGMVILVTSSMQVGMWSRLEPWFSDVRSNLTSLVDGIVIRQSIPEIRDELAIRQVSAHEASMLDMMRNASRIIMTPERFIKPHPKPLLDAIALANQIKHADAPPITPDQCVLIGDSPGSDGMAALRAGTHMILTTEGLTASPAILDLHAKIGCAKGELGLDALKAATARSSFRPCGVVTDIGHIFSHVGVQPVMG